MSELRTQGWTRTNAPAAILAEMFAGEPHAEPIHARTLEAWSAPEPADLHQPVIDPAHALHLVGHRIVLVHLVPGSQGLALPAEPGEHEITIRLDADEHLLADPRLWVRVSDPGAVSAMLVRARRRDTTERIDPGPDFALYSRGYTILRGGLSPSRVDLLRAALQAALDHDVAVWGLDHLKRIGQFGAIRNLTDMDQAFINLLADSPVHAVLARVMRPGFVLHSFDGLVLEPDEGRFPWDFHTDVDCLAGMAMTRSRIPAVNVLYYLDEVTRENGATWIVPASHLAAWSGIDCATSARLAIQATGQAGDILIFDGRLSHCAGNNTTRGSRRLIKTLFCEPWMQPQMNYRRALSSGKWDRLPEQVRALLGEGRAPPNSTAEFLSRMAAKVQ